MCRKVAEEACVRKYRMGRVGKDSMIRRHLYWSYDMHFKAFGLEYLYRELDILVRELVATNIVEA